MGNEKKKNIGMALLETELNLLFCVILIYVLYVFLGFFNSSLCICK